MTSAMPPVAGERVSVTYRRSPYKWTIMYLLPRNHFIAHLVRCPRTVSLRETTAEYASGLGDTCPRSGRDPSRRPSARTAGIAPGSSQPIKSPKQFLTYAPLAGVTYSVTSLGASTAACTARTASDRIVFDPFNRSKTTVGREAYKTIL